MNEKKKSDFIPIRQAVQLTGVNSDTIRRWASKNYIEFYVSPGGQRRFNKDCLLKLTRNPDFIEEKQKILYCRVSSNKQKDDLVRQIDFLRHEYPDHTVVTDIGSGLNWKRKGLLSILELSMQGKLGSLVVAHRDRLSRFAFELIEWIVTKNNGQIIVMDKDNEKYESTENELAEDLLSIVHIYSCKQMGKRRYKKNENCEISEIPKERSKVSV